MIQEGRIDPEVRGHSKRSHVLSPPTEMISSNWLEKDSAKDLVEQLPVWVDGTAKQSEAAFQLMEFSSQEKSFISAMHRAAGILV